MIRLMALWGIVVLFCAGTVHAAKVWISGRGDGFINCRKHNVRLFRGRDGYLSAAFAHNEYPAAGSGLLLHFNRVVGGRFPALGRGRVASQRVLIDRRAPYSGRGSALFLWPSHYVDLMPTAGSIFLEAENIGSFSIEFWLYPFSNYNGEEVFSRYGPFTLENGKAVFGGIRCVFYQERLHWVFRKFFRDSGGEYRDVVITARTRTALRTWQHMALVYDHSSGKLAFSINGVEDTVLWLTENSSYGGSPLLPAFHRNLHMLPRIGRSYLGKMDEFRISRTAVRNFRINRFLPGQAMVSSEVYDMGSSHSRLDALEARVSASNGTAVLLEYRLSDTIFTRDDLRIPWIRVRNGERRFPSGRFGRYLQWRALLLGADSGRYSPQLSQVKVQYTQARKIARPTGLVATAGDRKVVLRWAPNMGRIHGYRIYVGTKSGHYLNRNPIHVPLVTISSSRPEFVVYGLENDRLYYFAITAYDKRGLGHESRFSKEVYCRPSFLVGKR